MNVRIISYTNRGGETARRASDALTALGHSCRTFALPKFQKDGDEPLRGSASDWAKDGFETADALLFCCASGIAVRAIAAWVQDKRKDPAVLVLDERAQYVIPLLSGHIGGANALALALADALGATPVLTTATDVNGVFATDVFAERNRLYITDMQRCKEVSAALLNGEPVGFSCDLPVEGALLDGLTSSDAAIGIYVGAADKAPYARTLQLLPRRFAVGIGCKRGKTKEDLEAFLLENLAACGVSVHALLCVASIDLKREEPGLLALCSAYDLPFLTYGADALNAVPGTFSGSGFVQSATGVDCVCERAAVLASGGTLLVRKTARDGMTFALAKTKEGIRFV